MLSGFSVIFRGLYLATFVAGFVSQASANPCGGLFSINQRPPNFEYTGFTQYSKGRALRFGTFNVEVLGVLPDLQNPNPAFELRSQSRARDIAKTIRRMDADVLTLQEVRSINDASAFIRDYLDGEYQMIVSPLQGDGIQNIILVKNSVLGFYDLAVVSHANEKWFDPVRANEGQVLLFDRDILQLEMREKGRSGSPKLVVLDVHLKSKINNERRSAERLARDQRNDLKRKKQLERLASIIGGLRTTHGTSVPLVVAGDFNGDLQNRVEFQDLFGRAGLLDAFDLTTTQQRHKDKRTTLMYFDNRGRAWAQQIDGVLVSATLRGLVKDTYVVRFADSQAGEVSVPKNPQEIEAQQSDHFPILTTIDLNAVSP